MTVGVREAKARFSHYLQVARSEGEVVITDRGAPVARLVGIGSRRRSSPARVLAELVGAARHAPQALVAGGAAPAAGG